MLFHVNMTVRVPHDMPTEMIEQLTDREHKRASDLQRQGKWRHLWRIVGTWANVSIFDVESPTELHELLSSLPLFPFMTIEVVALCRHPGSLEDQPASSSGA